MNALSGQDRTSLPSAPDAPKHQFGLRAAIVLTAAIAIWFGLFQDASLTELAIFSGAALVAGVAGHMVYTLWLPWRITVVAMVLLIYNLILFSMLLESVGLGTELFSHLDFLVDVVVLPAEMAMHFQQTSDILWMSALMSVTTIFTLAHTVRPSLPTAIITAFGVGAWYATGILIMSHAG